MENKVIVSKSLLTEGQFLYMENNHQHNAPYIARRSFETVDIYCNCGNDFSISGVEGIPTVITCSNCSSKITIK